MLFRSWSTVLLAGLAVGCGSAGHPFGAGGSAGSANGGAGGQGSCIQGATRACLGPGACKGAQACGTDGLWSQCDCGSGAGGTGGSTSLDGGPDASSGGSGGSAGSGGSGGAQSCNGTKYPGTQLQLAMYIMMDKSGSMQGTKWNAVKTALSTFVNSGTAVAGIGVGLQFFPVGTTTCPTAPPCGTGCTDYGGICIPDTTAECNVNSYLPPAVGIQPLPGVAQQIINAMNAQTPGGGTPTLPALTSAEQATQAYAAAQQGRRVVIVLATDGEPNDCNSTVANVAAEAASGFNASPSIMTFVIGIGTVANLDTIAQAGGTGQAYILSNNIGQQFLDALNNIRTKAPGCGYLLPASSGTIDVSKLNVLYTPAGGTSTVIPKVQNSTKCGTGSGWYYDNPTNPSRIILCPTSCTTVKSGSNHIDIELGCPTQVK